MVSISSPAFADRAVYEPSGPFDAHRGVTASFGVGGEVGAQPNSDVDAGFVISGDVGLWLDPQLAVLAHATGASINNHFGDTERVDTFTGVDVQYWMSGNVWLAVGAGFGLVHSFNADNPMPTTSGGAFDARIGVSFPFSHARRERPGPEHAISLTAEIWGYDFGPFVLATIGYHYLWCVEGPNGRCALATIGDHDLGVIRATF